MIETNRVVILNESIVMCPRCGMSTYHVPMNDDGTKRVVADIKYQDCGPFFIWDCTNNRVVHEHDKARCEQYQRRLAKTTHNRKDK